MDKTLILKLQDWNDAMDSLQEVLKENKKNAILRDSAIKRFEYTFELCWKTTKIFLFQKYGVDVFSPKECFRALKANKLITEKEAVLLLEMTDDRNSAVHTYDENFANELYKKIVKEYFVLLNRLCFEVVSKNANV